jgi:hypothetical protein
LAPERCDRRKLLRSVSGDYFGIGIDTTLPAPRSVTCIPTFRIMSWQGGMRKVGTTFWEFFLSNLEMVHAGNTAGMTLIHL